MPNDELESDAFGAWVAWRRGDRSGFERRLANAASIAEPGSVDATDLTLLALRTHSAVRPNGPIGGDTDTSSAVASLVRAREAWARGDHAAAAQLLQESRTEGVDSTWFSEEAALLAADLGGPVHEFPADPPYPNRLRFIPIWELAHLRAGGR
jgi:hypothetical protein